MGYLKQADCTDKYFSQLKLFFRFYFQTDNSMTNLIKNCTLYSVLCYNNLQKFYDKTSLTFYLHYCVGQIVRHGLNFSENIFYMIIIFRETITHHNYSGT